MLVTRQRHAAAVSLGPDESSCNCGLENVMTNTQGCIAFRCAEIAATSGE